MSSVGDASSLETCTLDLPWVVARLGGMGRRVEVLEKRARRDVGGGADGPTVIHGCGRRRFCVGKKKKEYLYRYVCCTDGGGVGLEWCGLVA